MAIVFAIFGLTLAISMIIWKFAPIDPTWEELRSEILDTSEEDLNMCMMTYPHKMSGSEFSESEVGIPLQLSPMIKDGLYEEAAEASKVTNIFQSAVRIIIISYNNRTLFCTKNIAKVCIG